MNPPIVLVTPVLPWPPDQGNRQFLLDVARGLKELGPLIWVTRSVGDQAAAEERLGAEGFDLRLDRSFQAQGPLARLRRRVGIDLRAARAGRPREVAFTCTPTVRRLVREAVTQHPQARAVGAFWYTADALDAVAPTRRGLVLSDVEYHRLAEGRRAAGGNPEDRGVTRLRTAEVAAWDSVHAVVCLTEADRELVRSSPTTVEHVGLWPVTIAVEPECPPLRSASSPLRVLMYGHWQADFNRDGLEDFVGNCWPAIRQAHPSVQLRVVGAGLEPGLAQRLRGAGCEVGGWAPSILAELEESDVIALHLRYGGGLRYRLLEAMARGRACISNQVAARGAGAAADDHFLAADTPTAWADAVGRLHDEELRARVARSGWRFVVERYGPRGRADRLRTVLAPVLEDH